MAYEREEYDSPEERYYDKLDERGEDRSWWETLLLYGAIATIALVLIGVVFVRPKFTPATSPTGAVVTGAATALTGASIMALASKYKGVIFLVIVLGGVAYLLVNREQERAASVPRIITLEEAQDKALDVLADHDLENVVLKPMKRNRKDLMVYRFLFAEELIEGFNYHYPTGHKKRDRYFYQVSIDYYGNLDCFEESKKKLKSMEWINEKGDRAGLAATERWRRLVERNAQGPMESRDWEERERLLNNRRWWTGDPHMPMNPKQRPAYRRRGGAYRPKNVHYGSEMP